MRQLIRGVEAQQVVDANHVPRKRKVDAQGEGELDRTGVSEFGLGRARDGADDMQLVYSRLVVVLDWSTMHNMHHRFLSAPAAGCAPAAVRGRVSWGGRSLSRCLLSVAANDPNPHKP